MINDIEPLRATWEKLFENNPVKSVFQSFDYVRLWYQCFSREGGIRVLEVSINGGGVGFFPMVFRRVYGIRTLNSLTNSHCLLNSQIFIHGHENDIFKGIADSLQEHAQEWDLLSFQFRYSFEVTTPWFKSHLTENFDSNFHITAQPTYCILLPTSYDDYYEKHLPKHVKKNISYYSKRLSKKGIVEFQHYRDEEAIRHWNDFLCIEDSGWKGEARSSIMKLRGNFRQYYNGFVHLLGRHNSLHLYFLSLDGKKISGVFGYEDNETFHYAKTGYDEKYREFSPSNLLLVHLVKDLIANRPDIKRVHMFPWDYGYKHRFANEEAECNAAMIYNSNLRGQLIKQLKKGKAIAQNAYLYDLRLKH
jgi:hypothetical protein